jgi:hypothetical protein
MNASPTCRLKTWKEHEMLQSLKAVALTQIDILEAQREQYAHDLRNHSDILALHKTDRLKHYGLHFAKYVGRLARGAQESKSAKETLIDTFLVCLSAANTLHQKLSQITPFEEQSFLNFASAMGQFCDACEKIDHLEPFVDQARIANQKVCDFVLAEGMQLEIDFVQALKQRRKQLSERHFYIG